jgi:hypothetical protein
MKLLVLENIDRLDDPLVNYLNKLEVENPGIEIDVIYNLMRIDKDNKHEFDKLVNQIKACDKLVIQSTFDNKIQLSSFLNLFVKIGLSCEIHLLHTYQNLEGVFFKLSQDEMDLLKILLNRCKIFNVIYQAYEEGNSKRVYFKKYVYFYDSILMFFNKFLGTVINKRRVSFEPAIGDKHLEQKTIHINKEDTVIILNKDDKHILFDYLQGIISHENRLIEELEDGVFDRFHEPGEKVELIKEKNKVLSILKTIINP